MITPSEPNVVVAHLCQAGRNLAFAGREAICHQREAISNMRSQTRRKRLAPIRSPRAND